MVLRAAQLRHRRHDRHRHGGSRRRGVVKLSNADYLTRPLRLAPHEALALMVALRALREVSGAEPARGGRPRAGEDRGGAGDAASTGRRRSTSMSTRSTPDPGAGRAGAARGQRRHAPAYYMPGRDETTERDVDPMRLIFSDGTGLPGGLVPPRRGGAAVPARPDHGRRRCWTRQASPPEGAGPARPLQGPVPARPGGSDGGARPRAAGALGGRVLPDRGPGGARETADLRVRLRFSNHGWLQRLVLRLGRRRHTPRTGRRWPRACAPAPRRHCAQYAVGRSPTNPARRHLRTGHGVR